MKRTHRSDIRGTRKTAVLGTAAGWLVRILAATLRLDIRDHCGIGRADVMTPPVIYLLWHSRFLIVPFAWSRLTRGRRRAVILSSASKDGDMVARAMAVFGLGSVRGSSSRRGVAALVGLKRALEDGNDICLTPDGPKGPRYEVQPGAIKLSEATGAPMVPVHIRFPCAWRLGTWDRFVIPMPFSRVEVTFAECVAAPAADADALEAARLHVQQLLVAGTDDA